MSEFVLILGQVKLSTGYECPIGITSRGVETRAIISFFLQKFEIKGLSGQKIVWGKEPFCQINQYAPKKHRKCAINA